MGPVLHQSDILGGGVNTLTILYRPLEHVGELSFVTQKVGANKVNHTPVLDKIILQRISSQYNPSFCTDLLQSLKEKMKKNVFLCFSDIKYLRNGGVRVLYSVSLVTYN